LDLDDFVRFGQIGVQTLLQPNLDGNLPPCNLNVGNQAYALSISAHGTGTPVTDFEPPLSLVVRPTPDALAEFYGDPSLIPVAVLDPATGLFVPLATSINADGTLIATIAQQLGSLPTMVTQSGLPSSSDAAGPVDEGMAVP
jgi:hypothetical protein